MIASLISFLFEIPPIFFNSYKNEVCYFIWIEAINGTDNEIDNHSAENPCIMTKMFVWKSVISRGLKISFSYLAFRFTCWITTTFFICSNIHYFCYLYMLWLNFLRKCLCVLKFNSVCCKSHTHAWTLSLSLSHA